MSLKRFVQRPDIRAQLRAFRPIGPRPLPQPMRVMPLSKNPQRPGTAFDYLFRFELQRRNRRAEHGPWIAEWATGLPPIRASEIDRFPDPDELFRCMERQKRACSRVLRNAKKDVANYSRKRKPSDNDRACLASHALRLAAMDEVYRAGMLAPDLEEVDGMSVNELLGLLEIVPFESFVNRARTMLNPNFGRASGIVGGADADLIIADQLIDLKTTKDQSVGADEIDQLSGYFILARQARLTNRRFPLINRLALYYSRHAYLWTWDVTRLHKDNSFLAMEASLVQRAASVERRFGFRP